MVGGSTSWAASTSPNRGRHRAPQVEAVPLWVKAEPEGEWFQAIERKNCLALMDILDAMEGDELRGKKCWETGEQGRTALHVAAMQGCFRLAKQVIDNIGEKYQGCIIDAKDGQSGLTALEMAKDIIGHTSISLYIESKVASKSCDRHKSHVFYLDKSMGLYEAYKGTEWCGALEQGNCEGLLELLEYDSRYLFQTCNSSSVLDVAIIEGNLKLAKWVIDVFQREKGKITWPEQFYFPYELSFSTIFDERVRHSWKKFSPKLPSFTNEKLRFKTMINSDESISAMDLAELFRREDIKISLKKVQEGVVSKQQGDHSSTQDDQQFLWRMYDVGLFRTEDTKPEVNRQSITLKPSESNLPEFGKLMTLAKQIDKWWKEDWNEGFKADVDYNFEDCNSLRFSILRFHYALKDPELINVANDNYDNIRGVLNMYDGQGRPPYQTFIDYYNSNWFSG